MTTEKLQYWERHNRWRAKIGELAKWKIKHLKDAGFDFSSRLSKYKTFEEARKFVWTLNLKKSNDWRKYKKSKDKPDDIPSTPDGVYLDEFLSWGDWIGVRPGMKKREKNYLSFEAARKFVHSLKLKNQKEWYIWWKSNRPTNIPVACNEYYKNEFRGFGDWIGTGRIAAREMEYLPFKEARKFVRSLNIKSYSEWGKYCMSRNKPYNIPRSAHTTYKESGWCGWRNFFGISIKDSMKCRTKKMLMTLKNKNIEHA